MSNPMVSLHSSHFKYTSVWRTSLFIYIYHVYPCLCLRGSLPVPVNSLFVLYYTHCTQIYIQTSSVLSLEQIQSPTFTVVTPTLKFSSSHYSLTNLKLYPSLSLYFLYGAIQQGPSLVRLYLFQFFCVSRCLAVFSCVAFLMKLGFFF